MKKIFLLLALLMIVPAQAGELENAINAKKNVFLYVTAPWCGACKAFNPIYQSLENQYNKKFTFIKVDADSNYGSGISRKYNVRYIPYVRIIKPNSSQQIPYKCLVQYSCINNVLEKF